MEVRMIAEISGSVDGKPWPKRGGVIDLPDAEAERMISGGLATAADEVETADVVPDETAEAPAPKRGRARKPVTRENGPG